MSENDEQKPERAAAVERASGAASGSSGGPQDQPIYDARRMCGADGVANLVLDDKVYTLRITKTGKLILTK